MSKVSCNSEDSLLPLSKQGHVAPFLTLKNPKIRLENNFFHFLCLVLFDENFSFSNRLTIMNEALITYHSGFMYCFRFLRMIAFATLGLALEFWYTDV